MGRQLTHTYTHTRAHAHVHPLLLPLLCAAGERGRERGCSNQCLVGLVADLGLASPLGMEVCPLSDQSKGNLVFHVFWVSICLCRIYLYANRTNMDHQYICSHTRIYIYVCVSPRLEGLPLRSRRGVYYSHKCRLATTELE